MRREGGGAWECLAEDLWRGWRGGVVRRVAGIEFFEGGRGVGKGVGRGMGRGREPGVGVRGQRGRGR